jgi:urea transporter
MKRAVLYGGLLGYALTVLVTAYPREWLHWLVPFKGCYLGAQMRGSVVIDGPINATLYAISAVCLVKMTASVLRRWR